MKVYLKSIAQQLRHHSLSLEKTSNLINKPWALIDDEFEMQKLIFQRNKDLILSKNGIAQTGKWDYFPEAKSLLIDRNEDKILCKEEFVDHAVMILKLDGTENRYFILANENIIPDLDAYKYLKRLRYRKLEIVERRLIDGRVLEVQSPYSGTPSYGSRVTIDAARVEDGKYQLKEEHKYYEIKRGAITKIITEKKYTNPDGKEIFIHQNDNEKICFGDSVYMDGKPYRVSVITDEKINFTEAKHLIVREGKVVRLERKNPFFRKLSKICKMLLGVYQE